MSNVHYVLPIGSIVGKPVLSLETGNRLGELHDFAIDPINGLVRGVALKGADGGLGGLPYEAIHSFGHDAVMAVSEAEVRSVDELGLTYFPRGGDLIGTKIITVSGNVLGTIRDVFVTLQQQPLVVYSVGEGMLDKLLGREFYILASAGHAFSSDGERLVVPDDTVHQKAKSIEELLNPPMTVRSFGQTGSAADNDDTWVPVPTGNTPHRRHEAEFETVLHSDDDETVVRVNPD